VAGGEAGFMSENIVMPTVRSRAGKNLEVRVGLAWRPCNLLLAEMIDEPQRRVLCCVREDIPLAQAVAVVSNVNELTRLIDGLYALGAAWQKQDQAASGNERKP
jgi:hypothetical protein